MAYFILTLSSTRLRNPSLYQTLRKISMFCNLLISPKCILEAYCRFFLGEDKLTIAETFYVADGRLKK